MSTAASLAAAHGPSPWNRPHRPLRPARPHGDEPAPAVAGPERLRAAPRGRRGRRTRRAAARREGHHAPLLQRPAAGPPDRPNPPSPARTGGGPAPVSAAPGDGLRRGDGRAGAGRAPAPPP